MNRIINLLRNSHHILVVAHNNPDGDAIGSLIALGLSLDVLNKKTTLYNESPIPAVYRFLPSANRIVQHINNTHFDVAVILDCSDLKRIGDAASMVSKIPVIVNIDHHVTNTRFGHFQFIDTSACATAEIIYRFIKKMGVPINKDIATSIYTGILTDTGSFRFSNTNRLAFEICQEMVEVGVDPYDIAKQVYGTYSLGRIKLLNLALDSIEITNNGKLSIMTLTQDMFDKTHTRHEDVEGFINYARNIEDVKITALIKESCNSKGDKGGVNTFHISLRSNGTVDVASIASTLGGGGHPNAAGFSTESTLSDIKSILFEIAEKV
ncbi:MAG: bifunctional oligoribonuclease/PAP phosphatase NrnA [Desulfobacterales bacterium]|nr:MAG: bifunctional oligoribonuclease/PAP phosphatase NrnA [Desulfobacterales bacterium]